jgi:hypothetical protein
MARRKKKPLAKRVFAGKVGIKPTYTEIYKVTYVDGTKGLWIAGKIEVLEGGAVGFYQNLTDRFPGYVVSPTFYREILLIPKGGVPIRLPHRAQPASRPA